MIPLKNKKKSLEFTVSEIRDFSLKYIEKYAPSKQQLRTYLLKKYLKSGSTNMKKGNYQNLIDIVLSDLEQSKFINDKFVKETLDKIKENNDDQDFFSAIKLCKKKKIGPHRSEDNRPIFFKKDIGILARNGFSFETSKRIMDLSKDEYEKIIRLL